MQPTNRLIGLFAVLIISVTMMADVVYEPLIVDSGFNRDVIAETTSISTCAWSPLYDLAGGNAHTSCFGTKSVIAAVNADDGFSQEEYDLTVSCGWPDDYRDTIKCIEDAKDNYSDPNVFFMLAPYNDSNALCLRPDAGFQRYGTLKFKKIGCYDKIFFLFVSLRQGGNSSGRRVITTIHYTDGETTSTEFTFAGLGGEVGRRVHKTNIYESGIFKKHTSKESPINLAYASVFDIEVDNTKLIEKIVFENPKENSAAIVLGITGRTADAEIPDEEAATVSSISESSFEACWEAIADAASYRLDVAEDPDFQHILADYNNLVVSGSTCLEVAGLIANNDYYWRVRSVNANGQSASSKVVRVRTDGDNPPATNEESDEIESMLAEYAGFRAVVPTLQIHRTLYRDGYFNTLCLPFNMNATEIEASPLAGMSVYEYVHAEKTGDGSLSIEISGPIDHIDAGVPYLVKWAPTVPEIIDGRDLIFHNVNIVTSTGRTIGESDEVRFVGNIGIAEMIDHDENNLFLGAENTLYWPDGQTRLKGFRAYFKVPDGPSGAPKHTPARIVERPNTPTEVFSIQRSELSTQKVIRNGQLLIYHNGMIYNAQGIRMQ